MSDKNLHGIEAEREISRKLKAELAEAEMKLSGYYNILGGRTSVQVIADLKAELDKHRWISVSVRLPEYKKKVELCNINFPDGDFQHGHLMHSVCLPSGYECDEWFIKYGNIHILTSYTHWRLARKPIILLKE